LNEDLSNCNNQSNTLKSELEAAKSAADNGASAEELAKAQADNKRLMDELQAAKANASNGVSAEELAKAKAENQRLMGELQAAKLKAVAAPIPVPVKVVEPELDEEDSKDETLLRIREKAKNIDFGRLFIVLNKFLDLTMKILIR